MAKLISLAELRQLGATTFADHRRDQRLEDDRRRIARSGLSGELRLAAWQSQRASERCLRIARDCGRAV